MNRFYRYFAAASLAALMVSCGAEHRADYAVIPLPYSVEQGAGEGFALKDGASISYPKDNAAMERNARFLQQFVEEHTGHKLAVGEGEPVIRLELGLESENREAYTMQVAKEGVVISGASPAGVFYGIQTLRKSLPLVDGGRVTMPEATIADEPRFGYRGVMLDVSRHFIPADSVKTFIDLLALHNINRLHWHLTDDQGWRIEIKKYPRLTEVGSHRPETVIGHNTGKYDGTPHGGFYTQDEIRDIVAYAAERYITIIPEIDMPGHMLGALAAYPELGCTGGPYSVWTMWGVSDDVLCAGNPAVIPFLKDILTEVMELFPSEYIHLGGDECPKTRWEKCPKCQTKMRLLGLVSDQHHTREQRLQSYLISEIEQFLNAHGRQMIGWDEILEGGLAPNATVMAWRSAAAGTQAARMHHKAIMTPTSHLYFDYYQSDDVDNEPIAIGGYLPVERVYSFEPIDSRLNAEERKFILGTQANIWTEYMPSFAQVLYMALPRMAALSEVQWCQPEAKNYKEFLKRIPHQLAIYDRYGLNYATHIQDVTSEFTPDPATRSLKVELSTIGEAEIRYTLDGTDPTEASALYTEPLTITESATLKAAAFRAGVRSRIFEDTFTFNKASLKPITMLQPINSQYAFGGKATLVDGLHGNTNYKTGRWLGFYGNDLEAVIDLGEQTEISRASLTTCVVKGDWIFDARGMAVAVSADGKTFEEVASAEYPSMTQEDRDGVFAHNLGFAPVKARFVKITAKSERVIPEWHGGHGYVGFLFVDELVVE